MSEGPNGGTRPPPAVGTRDFCSDCPTAAQVSDLRTHQIHDLNHWAELRSTLDRQREDIRDYRDAIAYEVAGVGSSVKAVLEERLDPVAAGVDTLLEQLESLQRQIKLLFRRQDRLAKALKPGAAGNA